MIHNPQHEDGQESHNEANHDCHFPPFDPVMTPHSVRVGQRSIVGLPGRFGINGHQFQPPACMWRPKTIGHYSTHD
jgi:hypothetical protein